VAILAIIVGCVAIVAAFVSKNFYSADVWGGSISNKTIPKWLGRLGFLFVGVFMIICGIASLLFHQ
jgi:hypothetical protein